MIRFSLESGAGRSCPGQNADNCDKNGGKYGRIHIWNHLPHYDLGESHRKGVRLSPSTAARRDFRFQEEDVQTYLNRRKPGQSKFATARNEGRCGWKSLSGVFEGKTTGTPECHDGAKHRPGVPGITARSRMCTVRGMRITASNRNTDSRITRQMGVPSARETIARW